MTEATFAVTNADHDADDAGVTDVPKEGRRKEVGHRYALKKYHFHHTSFIFM